MTQLVERTVRGTASGRGHGRSRRAPVDPRARAVGDGTVQRQRHARRRPAAVAAAVLAVLLLATWSLAQGWGRGPVAGPGELVVDGGLLRVDGVVSAARPQHAMPGMGTDDDPVPAGHRRVSLDVTLLAGTSPVSYRTELFELTVDGEPADHLTHRDVLPVEDLPAGTQLSGTMVFDVPADARTGLLGYDGSGATEVVLPPESGSTRTGGAATHPDHAAGHGAPVDTPSTPDAAEAGQ